MPAGGLTTGTMLPSPRGDKLFPPGRRCCPSGNQLPSPRGDKLFLRWPGPVPGQMELPSPRGDKLFPARRKEIEDNMLKLPSPRGDKLFLDNGDDIVRVVGCYRPLAGISCFLQAVRAGASNMLPSPRGDKLFLAGLRVNGDLSRLPSPRGDKLFPGYPCAHCTYGCCYRPLAGISCFSKTIQIKRPCTGAELYSLPKRITQNCVQCKRQIEDSPTIQCEPGCFHPV